MVFLDCDGVLACARSVSYDYDEGDPTLLFDEQQRDGCLPLERRYLSNLKRALEGGGSAAAPTAQVVLSTTWRTDGDMRSFLTAALESEGIVGQRFEVLAGVHSL